jgi:hypothetical protein
MQTGAKGTLAVLKVLERCLEKGITASLPTIETRYDVVLDIDGKLWRAQVKYTDGKSGHSTGCVVVRTRSSNVAQGSRKYTEKEIDVILGYAPKTGKIYWLPPDVWRGKNSVTLRVDAAKNGQTTGLIEAVKFEW